MVAGRIDYRSSSTRKLDPWSVITAGDSHQTLGSLTHTLRVSVHQRHLRLWKSVAWWLFLHELHLYLCHGVQPLLVPKRLSRLGQLTRRLRHPTTQRQIP